MSHFSLSIITDTDNTDIIDGLLKPYISEHVIKFQNKSGIEGVKAYPTYDLNSNSKFNSYEIGGAYKNSFLLKDSFIWIYTAKINDIDFNTTKNLIQVKTNQLLDNLAFERILEDNMKMKELEYFVDEYKTKESYINFSSIFSTDAVITPDGKWQDNIKSLDSNIENLKKRRDWVVNFYDNFLKNNMDKFITVVTCYK